MTIPPADASLPFVASPSTADADAMLAAFVSVGGKHFDVTHTNLAGEKRGFRCNRTAAEVRQSMPHLVASSVGRQNNVIVRPRVAGATCIQLDDLNEEKLERIRPAAFLTLETSPGNFQAWVAIKDCPLGITARLRKGTGADLNASGATRVAGTHNFKLKYAPHFPVVVIESIRTGHYVTLAALEAWAVLAPEASPLLSAPSPAPHSGRQASKWPSYEQCLQNAPAGPSGHPQRTSVDFIWCKIATSWGHSPEAAANRLMQESTKAQENGAEYALKTAQRAAWAAAQRVRQMKP